MARELRPPRIFVGPIEIAGYYTRLAANLREIGVDAVAVDLSGHPFRYERGPRRPSIVRLAEAVHRADMRLRGWPRLLRVPLRAVSICARGLLFLWALWRVDVFIFGHAHTFFGLRELPILRAMGKTMIFVFNGSDARPTYVDGAQMRSELRRNTDDCIRLTRQQKARIRLIEQYASAIVSQPAFSHFFEKPVADFFRIGVPWIEPIAGTGVPAAGRIRILHSPSKPEVKGTAQIRTAVAGLVSDGYPIELIELQGQPNDVVRREIDGCDFVIDQLFSDAPMVGLATEAAAAGKAAIVGGYVWPFLRRRYPNELMPPVEQTHPDELREAILRLATDTEHRLALGRRAEEFVREAWAPRRIAERYLALIGGRLGDEYFFDPRTLDYILGVGFQESQTRALVSDVIARGGVSALQLADKPKLEESFKAFAAGRALIAE